MNNHAPKLLSITLILSGLSLSYLHAAPLYAEPEVRCGEPIVCPKTMPDLGRAEGFIHDGSTLLSKIAPVRHRAQDVYARAGDPVLIEGKFAYGLNDKDLEGEAVDVYLAAKCQGNWWRVGRTYTSRDSLATIGQFDPGGRISFALDAKNLAPGSYRVLLVVAGDHSQTEVALNVLPDDAAIVVSDIDGTLSTKETSAVDTAIGLKKPDANNAAAAVLSRLAERGYSIFYLTARPEWLVPQTRTWLRERGFPEGHIKGSPSIIGLTGSAAVKHKTTVLAELRDETGLVPAYAFGNTESDAEAYSNAGIDPDNSFYFKLWGDAWGGQTFDDYRRLLSRVDDAPKVCGL